MNFLKKCMSATVLLAVTMSSAIANDVTLRNVSKIQKSIAIAYKVALKNAGSAPVYSREQTVVLKNSTTIPLQLNRYKYTGIVITKVNGQALPARMTEFGKPGTTSVVTSAKMPEVAINLNYTVDKKGHKRFSMSKPKGDDAIG